MIRRFMEAEDFEDGNRNGISIASTRFQGQFVSTDVAGP